MTVEQTIEPREIAATVEAAVEKLRSLAAAVFNADTRAGLSETNGDIGHGYEPLAETL
jgi:hypothetical protein